MVLTSSNISRVKEVDEVTLTNTNGTLSIKTDGVDSGQIKADAVDTSEIKNNAVTSAKISGSVIDFCRGVTPTQSGTWFVEPTNLSNITDGDEITATNAMEVQSPNTGLILIDMGALNFTSSIVSKWIFTSLSASVHLVVQTSSDNSNWATIYDCGGTTTTNAEIYVGKKIRYIKFAIDTSGSGDCTLVISNLSAH